MLIIAGIYLIFIMGIIYNIGIENQIRNGFNEMYEEDYE